MRALMSAPLVRPRYAGPWPLVDDLVRDELDRLLAAATDPEAATRCRPWSVRDVTAHLAVTFARFADMLEQSRRDDLTPPFIASDISKINLDAVAAFDGDPFEALPRAVDRFVSLATDPHEVMAHQFGPIPVGLQMRFALSELVLHHDDVAAAMGEAYRPPDEVVEALLPVWEDVMQLAEPDERDPWRKIWVGSGRAQQDNGPSA